MNPESPKQESIILCVDDDATVLNALRSLLASSFGSSLVLEFAESGAEALEIAEDLNTEGRELSVVVSDFMMPGMRGDELLVQLHQRSPNTVKLLLTGQSDLSGVKRAINEANLYRFLEKPFNNEDIVLTIRAAIRSYCQERDLIRQNATLKEINANLESMVLKRTLELIEKNRELELLALTDRLTGLFNRRKLDQILEDEMQRSSRYAFSFSVIMIDIDHFKNVNDNHGHAVGDAVLMALAAILSQHTRESDVAARFGGEEFVIVCRHTGLEGAVTTAEKLRAAIAEHTFPVIGHATASFGVSMNRGGDSVVDLLARADAALYRAKDRGRNCVESEG